MKIGYHASHEQFPPSELLRLVKAAEKHGFDAVLSSDHFYPWMTNQGQSGYAWSWLGAAMQATGLTFGVVNAPGQRYNPAIIAQASATLAEMFPGRFWLAQGSGQLLNEAITGERWPSKEERNQRLLTSADIIRRLWRGETVTNREFYPVDHAKLYTRPERPPLMIAAALTPKTAEWAGSWADGLITVSQAPEKLAEIIEAFRKGGGAGKPLYLKVQISYAASDEEALEGAWDQWRSNIFPSSILTDLRSPEQFDALGENVKKEQMHGAVIIGSDPETHCRRLLEFLGLGFEHLYLHNVNRRQARFIEDFGRHVLPALRSKGSSKAA